MLVDVCDDDGDRYRFGFNGQEKVNEWAGIGNNLDFGERGYDSRVGRFLSIDPLTQSFPYYTPYQFAGNRVISSIDLDGLEDIYFMDKKIESIQGEPMLKILKGVEIAQSEILKFKDPAYNKGYNVIVLDGFPVIKGENQVKKALTKAATSNLFSAGTVANYQSDLSQPDNAFTDDIINSSAFRETAKQKRGVVFVYLPKGSVDKTRQWAKGLNDKLDGEFNTFLLGDRVKSLIHEFIAHAFKKVRLEKSDGDLIDHLEYYDDPENDDVWKPKTPEKTDSPSDDVVKKRFPKSKAGKVSTQVDIEVEAMKRVDHKK